MDSSVTMAFAGSLAILCLAPACNRSDQRRLGASIEANKQVAERFDRIDDFVCEGPLFLKNKSFTQVRQLGKLMSEKVTFEKNPHLDNEKIEFRTLKFDGLEVSGIVDKDSFTAISVIVTSPRWAILHGLNVGTSASRVPSALGQPPRPMTGPIEEFTGQAETVDFTVEKGIITKIEFTYYYD